MMKKIIAVLLLAYLVFVGWRTFWDHRFASLRVQENERAEASLKTTRSIPDSADYGAYLASMLAKENKEWHKTLSYYQKVLKEDPLHPGILTDSYILQMSSGYAVEALPLARQLQKEEKEASLLIEYLLIAEAVKENNFHEARRLLEEKSDNHLSTLLDPVLKAWIHVGLNEKKEAYAALKELKDQKDLISLFWYQRALIAVYFGDSEIADASFKKLKETGIPVVSAWHAIASFYEKQGGWRVENPLFSDYYTLLLKKPMLQGILKQVNPKQYESIQGFFAEAYYNAAVASDSVAGLMMVSTALFVYPDHIMSLLLGAEFFEQMRIYDLSNQYYDRMPQQTDLLILKKALNLKKMGKNDAVLKILKELIHKNPQNALLHQLIGEVYADLKQDEQALKHYTTALSFLKGSKNKTDLSKVYLLRAESLERLGRIAESEKDFEALLILMPDNPSLLNDLGYRWLERDKNIDQAVDMIERAHKAEPKNPYILDSLAFAYFKKGLPEKALPFAEKAADHLPQSSLVNMHLGDIYRALGRETEAMFQFKKALDLKFDLTPDLKKELEKKRGVSSK